MNNLNGVIARMQIVNESQVYSALGVPKVEPSPEQLSIWRALEQHAARRVVRPFPSSPGIVADFLSSIADADLEAACSAIVAVHNSVGASNPCATIAVQTILERRLRAECPRSWSKEDRQFFVSLARETQVILTRRENERDAALRRQQQNELDKRKGVSRELAEALRRKQNELLQQKGN
jgi:hypothetical protein